MIENLTLTESMLDDVFARARALSET